MTFGNMNILEIIMSASIVVQIDFVILIICSILSWGIIFRKYFELKNFKSENERFYNLFLNQKLSLSSLSEDLANRDHFPLKLVFDSGFMEYTHFCKLKEDKQIDLKKHFLDFGLNCFSRALVKGQNESLIYVKKSLTTLASIGSISPFIGLFGTVWGIIHSFASLSSGNASLQSVAPGIAEALIATAIGLIAAIPAVWFYNHYDSEIDDLKLVMESFGESFVNRIEKSLL